MTEVEMYELLINRAILMRHLCYCILEEKSILGIFLSKGGKILIEKQAQKMYNFITEYTRDPAILNVYMHESGFKFQLDGDKIKFSLIKRKQLKKVIANSKIFKELSRKEKNDLFISGTDIETKWMKKEVEKARKRWNIQLKAGLKFSSPEVKEEFFARTRMEHLKCWEEYFSSDGKTEKPFPLLK